MPDPNVTIRCRVNGADTTIEGHPMARLLDVLRHDLRLTGTKEGCGEGECGACSVMLDGQLVNSCLVPLLHADGAAITTIEGVADGGLLHAVQESFVAHGGAQCGICTPGMVLAAVNLLESNPEPTEADVRVALAGNLCRCTGYMRIFDAVLQAAVDSVVPSAGGAPAAAAREQSESGRSAWGSGPTRTEECGGGAPRQTNK